MKGYVTPVGRRHVVSWAWKKLPHGRTQPNGKRCDEKKWSFNAKCVITLPKFKNMERTCRLFMSGMTREKPMGTLLFHLKTFLCKIVVKRKILVFFEKVVQKKIKMHPSKIHNSYYHRKWEDCFDSWHKFAAKESPEPKQSKEFATWEIFWFFYKIQGVASQMLHN